MCRDTRQMFGGSDIENDRSDLENIRILTCMHFKGRVDLGYEYQFGIFFIKTKIIWSKYVIEVLIWDLL